MDLLPAPCRRPLDCRAANTPRRGSRTPRRIRGLRRTLHNSSSSRRRGPRPSFNKRTHATAHPRPPRTFRRTNESSGIGQPDQRFCKRLPSRERREGDGVLQNQLGTIIAVRMNHPVQEVSRGHCQYWQSRGIDSRVHQVAPVERQQEFRSGIQRCLETGASLSLVTGRLRSMLPSVGTPTIRGLTSTSNW